MDLKRVFKIGAGFVLGGSVLAGAVVAGAIRLSDFDDNGNVIKSKTYAHELPLNIYMSASGSLAAYDSFAVLSPLTLEGAGTGVILDLQYDNIANPEAVSHDICFVGSTLTASGSHACPLENTCTATGCTSVVSLAAANLSSMIWNGDLYLAGKTTGTYSAQFRGRIRGTIRDIAGE